MRLCTAILKYLNNDKQINDKSPYLRKKFRYISFVIGPDGVVKHFRIMVAVC